MPSVEAIPYPRTAEPWLNLPMLRDAVAADLATLIEPELQELDLAGPYVLLASEAGILIDHGAWGTHYSDLAQTFRDRIKGYTKNGPAWFVNDVAILKAAGSVKAAVDYFVAICCHELAHALEVPGLCQDVTEDKWWHKPVVKSELAEPRTKEHSERQKVTHQLSFVRLALHVRHRMQQLGWRIWLGDLLTWDRDTIAPQGAHLHALKPEFEALSNSTLSEVANVQPPKAFTELFVTEETSQELNS